MAIVKVTGSPTPQNMSETTIGAIKRALGLSEYTALLNGAPADDSQVVGEMDRVNLARASKAGV